MKTTSIQIQVPTTLLAQANGSLEVLTAQAQLLLAVQYFKLGLVNFGQAAEMCGLVRAEFLAAAKELGVPVDGIDSV